jgi:hypothetical protein
LTRDKEFQEKVKTMEREKFKLQEDNDRYRRQLGVGMAQMVKKATASEKSCKREYNAGRKPQISSIISTEEEEPGLWIGESDPEKKDPMDTARWGQSNYPSQMRQEYEEQLEGLNDESVNRS